MNSRTRVSGSKKKSEIIDQMAVKIDAASGEVRSCRSSGVAE
jgi:hypothetical protein